MGRPVGELPKRRSRPDLALRQGLAGPTLYLAGAPNQRAIAPFVYFDPISRR
ncbi:hypothetical protein [Sphaerothrix gracilis]|uniref:hypothetical protein n=1 Tax=Sphaerothrix gracilis TaxID=3151835 RepID=UPI0031FE2A3D